MEHRLEFFPRRSMFWRVNREMVSLLAGGRALLMQIAHPKVAAGVAEHSRFKEDPLGRLHRTMNTMWSIVFDEAAAARVSLERVRSVHGKVRGVVAQNEASFTGARYDALDPDLLLWVHATLIDSGMVAYDNFVAPLSPVEASRYYEESKILARLFDIPEGHRAGFAGRLPSVHESHARGESNRRRTQRGNAGKGNSLFPPLALEACRAALSFDNRRIIAGGTQKSLWLRLEPTARKNISSSQL